MHTYASSCSVAGSILAYKIDFRINTTWCAVSFTARALAVTVVVENPEIKPETTPGSSQMPLP